MEQYDFYLRFTTSTDDDMTYRHSLWIEWNEDDPSQIPSGPVQGEWIWVDKFECWCMKHSGLSGHYLEAQTLEEALEEVREGRWFGNISHEEWAIFEGTWSIVQDTPEGDTFTPHRVVFSSKDGSRL